MNNKLLQPHSRAVAYLNKEIYRVKRKRKVYIGDLRLR